MHNLLNFIIKKGHWILFVLLETISFVLLFRFNNYQGSVYLSSVNAAAAYVNGIVSDVKSYFGLKSENETLFDENVRLRITLEQYRDRLSQAGLDTVSVPLAGFEVKRARVIKNSLNHADNYITLDKGSADGVYPDMGVVGTDGVVGIIYMTSEHRSLAISLLNSKSNISCKLKHRDYFGNLVWEDINPEYALLKDIPRHAEFYEGDTVVTSGYSAVFPEGIPVGIVEEINDSEDGLFFELRVRLSTDFSKINDVRIINDRFREEEKMLDKKAGIPQDNSR